MIDPACNSQSNGYLCPSFRDEIGNSTILGQDPYMDIDDALALSVSIPVSAIGSYQRYNTALSRATTVPATAAYTKTFTIHLNKLLPDSIFNVDKIIDTDVLYLQLTFKPSQYWGFYTDGAVVPSTKSNFSVVTAANNISNLNLLVYQESNAEVIKIVKSMPSTMVVPYIYGYTAPFTTSGSQTSNMKIVSPSENPENRCLKNYYIVTLPDQTGTNNATTGAALTTLCNSSNASVQSVTTAGSDPFATPKLITNFQNYVDGDMTLQLQNYWDIAAHALSCHDHSFKGDLDYMLNSCVPTTFIAEKCGRYYDGETLQGLPLRNNQLDIQTNINTSPIFNATTGIGLLHHMFAIILTKIYMNNSILSY